MSSIYGAMEFAIVTSVDFARKINVAYFYQLLCTSQNMNLIHKKCHSNDLHEGKYVDDNYIFLP